MSILLHILGLIAIRRSDGGSGRPGGGPTNAWPRWVCVAAALATAPAAPADEHDGSDLLSLLAGAVLDWCDAQGGDFRLPHISAPSCETGEVVYLGTLKGVFGAAMAPDADWWWELRTGLPDDLSLGVLWYVGRNDPKELCAASKGRLCQCPPAHAALNNPARVPVVLVGPGASVCEAD